MSTTMSSNEPSEDPPPQSVEEAGALLGAAILSCQASPTGEIKPPPGMHSSFRIQHPVPGRELFARLFQLRQILLQKVQDEMPAAPSVLAVLMKLLGVSSSLAAQFVVDGRVHTPPLWSTPIRKLWVDCVVQCHVLGAQVKSSTGGRVDIYAFLKNMIALAGLNPKSQKASGGTRMAALEVIRGLVLRLSTQLAPWALDIFTLVTKSLKSSGNGEPSYRVAALQTAQAVAQACRTSWQERRQANDNGNTTDSVLMKGSMEDRAIAEALKILKQATTDKYPEIRHEAAIFMQLMAPQWLLSSRSGKNDAAQVPSHTTLDDCLSLVCYKNLDDESVSVALAWANAMARCLLTATAYNQADSSNRDATSAASPRSGASSTSTSKSSMVDKCQSIRSCVQHLVQLFIKMGGEMSASRLGGPFSVGGRATRAGIGHVLVQLFQLQSPQQQDYEMGHALQDIFAMVGPALEKQQGITAKSLFGKTTSPADTGLARLVAGRILREGMVELAPESKQLALLHALVDQMVNEQLSVDAWQVALTEISHLLSTLGDASGSVLEDLIPFLLQTCLKHSNPGIRHDASMMGGTIATIFPVRAKLLLTQAVEALQIQHAELVTQATVDEANADSSKNKAAMKTMSRFQRKQDDAKSGGMDNTKAKQFQFAIHGYALVVAILLRELAQLPGGLPADSLAVSLSVGEILVTCQYIDILTKVNPSGACTCVRAGYSIMCGALTVGPDAITSHVALIFGLWKRASSSDPNTNFTTDHELLCLDAALSSTVAFLQHCSELLLVVPDALSTTTLLLEHVLPLFSTGGRLATTPAQFALVSRHQSAKSSIMEAFAWLPPGSFPMISNDLFNFALQHVQNAIETEVVTSLLPSLVNNEDKLLDAKSICRVDRCGQVGGARDIDNACIIRNSESCNHGERESVMHLQDKLLLQGNSDEKDLWGSHILGLFAYDGIDLNVPPTALHEVGTWRRPQSPSGSSKVRLVDSAVQAFSATFGMKDGKEQQHAMLVLEQMVPPLLTQLARAMGVNSTLTEVDRRSKPKDADVAAVANITAVLLACLKALPLHEATHDIPIGLGPPWMNKAKDILLTLLPSTSNVVRRSAAEGLALLATLGVTEDAHTLQSAVLHSLDEVMQGNKPDGKPRPLPLEPVSNARAGSLLTLGCIQRTATNIKLIHKARSKGRSTASESAAEAQRDALPTIQMLTRILPSLVCHAVIRDAFVPRTYALHAFSILLSYSTYQKDEWSPEDDHLLMKAVESVEDNFLSCWTAVSADMDGGQEPEKLAAEASFLAVIVRMMTLLLPYVDLSFSQRFVRMVSLIEEEAKGHPVITIECMAFLEVVSKQNDMDVPSLSETVCRTVERAVPVAPPQLANGVTPCWSLEMVEACSIMAVTATKVKTVSSMTNVSDIYRLLDGVVSVRCCSVETTFRCLAAPRAFDKRLTYCKDVEKSIIRLLATVKDSSSMQFIGSQNRWQVRAAAAGSMSSSLKSEAAFPQSKVAELLMAACGAVIATSESHELRPVQEIGCQLLSSIVIAFGHLKDPAEPDTLLFDQFSSQVFASVKHAVTLPSGEEKDEASVLFVFGCKALESLLTQGIISDPASFKRLVRPIIPSKGDTQVVPLAADAKASHFRSIVSLAHIAKVSTVAKILAMMETRTISEETGSFLRSTIKPYLTGVAVHCAAIAVDGWRLSKGLGGSGFFYGNTLDLTEDMATLLIASAPSCMSMAMTHLCQLDNNDSQELKPWSDIILNLASTCYQESIASLSEATSPTVFSCLLGFKSVVLSESPVAQDFVQQNFSHLVSGATSVLQAVMNVDGKGSSPPGDYKPSSDVVIQACHLLESIASRNIASQDQILELIASLLTPLSTMDSKEADFAIVDVARVVTSNIKSIESLLGNGNDEDGLAKAMLEFAADVLSRKISDTALQTAAESLLKTCLSNASISTQHQEAVAQRLAEHDKFKAWSLLCQQSFEALVATLPTIRKSLTDYGDTTRHVESLSAIQAVISTTENINIVMKSAGPDCLALFCGYATATLGNGREDPNRMVVCTGVLKLLMAALQQAAVTFADEPDSLAALVSIMLEVWIGAIRYNGLPNQQSPQPGANPMLGRLSSQAISHVARSSPNAFKQSLGSLDEQQRAILEFAVRSDMSGYASSSAGSQGAAKPKKLNLKSFKK